MIKQKKPAIPDSHYPVRWEKLQEIMQKMDLDLILAYADDRATYGAAYARYYANFPTHFEPVLIMFIRGSQPVFLCGPETIGYTQIVSKIKDIRVITEFACEDEDYPFTRIQKLGEIVSQCISKKVKRVGIAGKNLMGAELYEAIAATFHDCGFVRVEKEMDCSRGVKTAEELDVIRHAYEIAHLGMTAAIEAIRPGVTEREIAARAEFAMRSAGSEGTGIDTIVASGENTRHILARTTFREIQENDVVLVTVAPRYEGYHGAIARTTIVGNPGEKVIESIRTEITAQNLCADNLIAGKTGSEVEAMGRKVMQEAGYGENFLYSGLHSIGVVEFEPPIFGPSSRNVLEKNMVISIDIPLFEADICGSRVEDGYIITDGKAEKLTRLEKFIRK